MLFTPTVLGSGVTGYAFLTRTRDTQQDLFAKSPAIARETEKVLSDLRNVHSSDALMEDRALLKVALGAFGLDDDLNNRAFIKQILDSDLTDSSSLANKLADKRYRDLASAFNFRGEDGPKLPGGKSASEVEESLANVKTADDLLKDPKLLRATLESFGLEGDMSNTYFLRSVLNSDLSDPSSFANRLSDPRYAELARAFDLAGKSQEAKSIYAFAEQIEARDAPIRTADDLLSDPALRDATLRIFGLEGDRDRTGFLTRVLEADPRDPDSLVNQLDDTRYLALNEALGLKGRAEAEAAGREFTSRLEKFASIAASRETRMEEPKDLFNDPRLMLATFDLFDLPSRGIGNADFVNRILTSDRDDPTSLLNVFPDKRYEAFADALNLSPKENVRTYPAGFAETIVNNYLDRQFEARVGDQDPSMRFALALDRDLNRIAETGKSNDSRWFAIMASKPMREVFETVFRLPTSFGTLDVDRQLSDLKARAESFFGTDQVTDFAQPERIDELRRAYLIQSEVKAAGQFQGGTNAALTLLTARFG